MTVCTSTRTQNEAMLFYILLVLGSRPVQCISSAAQLPDAKREQRREVPISQLAVGAL